MANKNLEELVEQLVERVEAVEAQNVLLQATLEKSELFFTVPELQLMSANKLPSVEILASGVTQRDSNMHGLEQDDAGIEYRWLGPGRITNYRLPVDRSQRRDLKITFKSEISQGFFESLRLYVDGVLQSFDQAAWQDDDGTVILATLETSKRAQDTLISVLTPEPLQPSDLVEESTDDRPLSVAFVSLEIW